MAETKTDPKADPEVGRIHSLEEIHSKLDKLLAAPAAAPPTASTSTPPAGAAGSVEEQVERAVAAAKEKEQAQTDKQKLDDRLLELEKRTEKPPRERRWITSFFWGNDE